MEKATLKRVPLNRLFLHSQNPRLIIREEVVEAIAEQIRARGEFEDEHALIVRPMDDGYQIVSGRHRFEAAKRAEIAEVPCWVKPMTDGEAFFALVLENTQSELSPLEIGMHALEYVSKSKGGRGKKGGIREYAKTIGKDRSHITRYRQAAIVVTALKETGASMHQFVDKAQHLAAIHAALDVLANHRF